MSRTAKAVDGLKAYEVPDPDDQPLMNTALEDILALAGEDERETYLRMWLHIGAAYLVDLIGAPAARQALKEVGEGLGDDR